LRVLRGGSFDYTYRSVRCAFRYVNSPGYRYNDLGFRVCVSSRSERSE
jgi:formylglycine-generating enzyme required for sulfatase activity